jgi:beta-phosphoglucomutase-like phosphatase (HAD superfamily)
VAERNLSPDVPIRAVIFDFNGTLSQDEPVLCRIYRELFAEYGKPISDGEYYERLSGLAEHTIAELCLGSGDPRIPAFIRERIDRYRLTVADGSTVTEPMRAAVGFAAEHARLAIVSGAAREEIVPVVAAAGLGQLFATVVADDDVDRGKPDPESYLLALEALGAAAGETLVFEDTEAGVAAAKAAGTRVIAVLGTQRRERLADADELVEAIDVALLRRLLA